MDTQPATVAKEDDCYWVDTGPEELPLVLQAKMALIITSYDHLQICRTYFLQISEEVCVYNDEEKVYELAPVNNKRAKDGS